MSGEMPAGWRRVSLSDCLDDCRNGWTYDSRAAGGTLPITRIETISDGVIDYSRVGYVAPDERLEAFRLKRNDILFSHINSVAHIAKVALKDDDSVLFHGMNLMRLRPSNRVDPYFLFARLQSDDARMHFRSICKRAVNQASLHKIDIGSYGFWLPPLPEQRRIGSVLRSIDVAGLATARSRKQLERIRALMLASEFRAVGSHSLSEALAAAGWVRVRLGDVFAERKEHGQPGLPLASISIERGLVLRSSLDRRVQSMLAEEAHALVRKGDIAYNMMRMWQGACGLAEADCCVSPAYVVMTPSHQVLPEFALLMLRSPPVVRLLHAYSQGIVDDRLRLYPDAFSRIPISLPPLVVQEEVVRRFLEIDADVDLARRVDEQFPIVKPRLSEDLLSGQTRVAL